MASTRQHRTWIFDAHPRAAAITLALTMVFVLAGVAAQAAQAQKFTVIHNFTGGPEGVVPWAGLTLDSSGNLFGTAFQGGNDGWGMVFKLRYASSGWIFSPLYSFTGGDDGSEPLAALTLGRDSSLTELLNSEDHSNAGPFSCDTLSTVPPQY